MTYLEFHSQGVGGHWSYAPPGPVKSPDLRVYSGPPEPPSWKGKNIYIQGYS